MPFYFCAPNDVWSLGVILVNLTCGRNPWKQASFEDSTYHAFTRNSDFLKTILPLSDELNDILGRIFTRNPKQRITLPELRTRILACPSFTVSTVSEPQALLSPPASPKPVESYDTASVADFGFGAPLSPATSDSDGESTCSSDDGSLTSSASTIDDLDDDDLIPDEDNSPRVSPEPQMFDQDVPPVFVPDFMPQFTGSVVEPCQPSYRVPAPGSLHNSSAPKFQLPYIWDMFNKYAHPVPLHNPVPYHHSVPLFGNIQGCY
jgi:serine/threonine protein kinase